MATAQDIEDVFGIPNRTVATWSRTTGSQLLLSKFLKSFSKYDLEERMTKILEQESYIRMSMEEFSYQLLKHLDISGIKEFENIQYFKVKPKYGNWVPDEVIEADGEIFIIEFKQSMPSISNFHKEIKIFDKYVSENFNQKSAHVIYINSNNTKPKFIQEDATLSNRISVYSYDEIALKLFNTKIILI